MNNKELGIENPSEEFLSHLADSLLAWADDESALTLPQFLARSELPYSYLRYFSYMSPVVFNALEVTKAKLFCRWLEKAIDDEKKLSKAHESVLLRYLRFYDSHTYEMETQKQKELEEAKTQGEMRFAAEQYNRAKLEEPYREIYDRNIDKRRGREETK